MHINRLMDHTIGRITALAECRRPVAWTAALFILSIVLLLDLAWSKPYYNWDLLGYVAVVHSYSIDSPDAIHRATYSDVKDNVPAESNQELISGSRFRVAMATNAEQFYQQLPFYSVKALYPAMMALIGKFGVDLVTASIVISRIAYCLIGFLCFYWISRHYAPLSAALIVSLFVSFPFLLDLSRFSTPDALSTLMLLAGAFMLVETKYVRLALGVFLTAILARPDNMLFALVLTAIGFLKWDVIRGYCAAAAVAAILTYSALILYSGFYGWATLIHHGFVETLLNPAMTDVEMGIQNYAAILAKYSHPLVLGRFSYSFLLFVLLNFVALRLAWANGPLNAKNLHILAANLLYSIGHWLVFPSQKERTLVICYLLVLVILLIEVQNTYRFMRFRANKN